MTSITIIRHAPTAWNLEKRIQGHVDEPLNAKGREMAANWRLPGSPTFQKVLASPLVRVQETARLMGYDPIPDRHLIEMDWGQWEGETLFDLRKRLGPAMAENEARGLDFRPEGGESPRDVQERLKRLLIGIEGDVLAFSHKGVLRALYALARGWDMTCSPPDRLRNAHAHRFLVNGDGPPSIDRLNISLEGHL
ncbi:MAG: histidine phosphatase family protein [Magnetovibrionaceae bacterium]